MRMNVKDTHKEHLLSYQTVKCLIYHYQSSSFKISPEASLNMRQPPIPRHFR